MKTGSCIKFYIECSDCSIRKKGKEEGTECIKGGSSFFETALGGVEKRW